LTGRGGIQSLLNAISKRENVRSEEYGSLTEGNWNLMEGKSVYDIFKSTFNHWDMCLLNRSSLFGGAIGTQKTRGLVGWYFAVGAEQNEPQ